MAAATRRLAAIMFTDMVGYSALAQADEPAALQVLERHNRILRPIFARHQGREIKTVGDAFLVEFDSALAAVECALDAQRALHEFNLSSPEDWKVRIRIGIHIGDVVPTGGDILGDAVNIAARIQPLAEPGGVTLTQPVYDLVRNKIPTPFERLPPRELKNIRQPVTVYRVVRPWEASATPVGEGSAVSTRHLAVLPLTNISPDPSDAYFADGLTEELISVLSQVPTLTVIARSSVTPYKTQPKSVAEIGHDLGVGTIVEGSVRKSGNRLRISLQLIDVSTQRHIWAQSYNREIDDVFAVQSDVAERTAQALRVQLAEATPSTVVRQPTSVPEAYDAYLHGLVEMSQHPEHDLLKASASFAKATELDPKFADAYAAWATALVSAAGDHLPMKESIPKARELTDRALALDPESSEGHAALANVLFQSDNDWRGAEEEFRRSIALNPSNVTAHRFLGLMLIALQRDDEAKEVLRQALRLDPAGRHQMTIAMAQLYGGDAAAALDAVQEVIPKGSTVPLERTSLGFFFANAGRPAEARGMLAPALPPGASDSDRFDHALLAAMTGDPGEGKEWLERRAAGPGSEYVSGTELAMLHASMGETDRALDLLESEYRAGERVLWLYYQGRWFDPIRREPRFAQLLREYGLPVGLLRDGGPASSRPSAPPHQP